MADRLSIDKAINDNVIPLIDKTKYLGLDVSSIPRIELFMFAMSLGVKAEKRTPLNAKHGFILETSIPDEYSSMMFSLLVVESSKVNEDELIGNKEEAFKIAQEYANTGFRIIQQWIESGISSEEKLYELIGELDDITDDLHG